MPACDHELVRMSIPDDQNVLEKKNKKKYRPYAGLWMDKVDIIFYGWFEE